jgi:[ribosomal protein S5]-alanine N-acetyltransferase
MTRKEVPAPARHGPRVHLAFPRRADEREVLSLYRRSCPFHQPWTAPPRTPVQFAHYLARCRRSDFIGLLLRRRADDALLGAVELSQIARGAFQSAYLGYHIGAPFARQGYMREGLGLVLDYAFRQLRLHRLEANIQPENVASIALVQTLGFQREGYSPRYLKLGGRWRDHQRWALLAEDWVRGRRRARSGSVRQLPN